MAEAPTKQAGVPYCGNCGYDLTGLVDSSKCPECGKPLVDVLSRIGKWGNRYRSRATLFGLPIVDVAYGPVPGEKTGHARGVFAFGDKATGLFAMGGFARGFVAIGGIAIGGITAGGCSIGLISAIGGVAIGALVYGGVAAGLVASGGLAFGVVAVGGVAIGYAAAGGAPIGVYMAGPGGSDPEIGSLLDMFSFYLGPPSFGLRNMIQPVGFTLGLMACVGAALGAMSMVAHFLQRERHDKSAA